MGVEMGVLLEEFMLMRVLLKSKSHIRTGTTWRERRGREHGNIRARHINGPMVH